MCPLTFWRSSFKTAWKQNQRHCFWSSLSRSSTPELDMSLKKLIHQLDQFSINPPVFNSLVFCRCSMFVQFFTSQCIRPIGMKITLHGCHHAIFHTTICSKQKWASFHLFDCIKEKPGRGMRQIIRSYYLQPQYFSAVAINRTMNGKAKGFQFVITYSTKCNTTF